MQFTWTMGRRLASATRPGSTKVNYTYNADGLRTSKTVNDEKYIYYWNSNKLTAQTWGENSMYFRYDGDTPIGFKFNGTEYYYVTNLQGDIIAILDSNGTCVAEYSYDAWGRCSIIKDTNTIAYTNPLLYRGYYYDSDTDLYYLQSRYYDANILDSLGGCVHLVLADSFVCGVNLPVNICNAHGIIIYYVNSAYSRTHKGFHRIAADSADSEYGNS